MDKAKFMLVTALALAACARDGHGPKQGKYALRAAGSDKDKVVLTLEVADTNEARLQGFQHRKDVPAGTGMLFVFDKPDYHAMWMKNTLVPLDMIFLNDARVVVAYMPDRVPLTEDYITPCNMEYETALAAGRVDEAGADKFFDKCEAEFTKPGKLTRYVIEVPAGTAARHGIKAGDILVAK